jgi:hypothetical protein
MSQEKQDYFKNLNVPAFLERPDVQAFIGPNFEKFKEKWLKDYAKSKDAARMLVRHHWNLMAFLFWPAWFAYRKMWKNLLMFSGAFMAIFVLESVWVHGGHNPIPSAAYTGVHLVIGLMATNMYFMHVVNFFHDNAKTSPTEMNTLISEKGGTSWVLAVAGALVYLVAVIGVIILSDAIFPPPQQAPAAITGTATG